MSSTIRVAALFALLLGCALFAPAAQAQSACPVAGSASDDDGVSTLPTLVATEGSGCISSHSGTPSYDSMPFASGAQPEISVYLPDEADRPADAGHAVQIQAQRSSVNTDVIVRCSGGTVTSPQSTLARVTLAQGESCPLFVQTTFGANLIEYTATLTRPDAEDYVLSSGTVSGGAFGGTPAPLDVTGPRVTTIVRQSPAVSPTNADSVTWRVTFDEPVANVTIGDFAATGTTGTIASVTNPVGDSYDVTVSGGNLAGLDATVTLGFSGGQDITDSFGNALTNTTPTGSNDDTFVVDNTAPTGYAFTIDQDPITAANVGAVSVTFAGLEVGSTYSYSLSSSGGGTPLTGSGTALTTSGSLPGADASGLADGTITASITLTDAAGNVGTPATDTATKDTTAPRVASIARQNPSTSPTSAAGFTWRVTFDEAVTGVTLSDFTMTPAIRPGQGSLSISHVSSTIVDISATGFDVSNFELEWTLAVTGGISDLVGNAMSNFVPVGASETFVTDRTRPRIASIIRQAPGSGSTAADSVTWRVTFDEAVQPPLNTAFGVSNTTGDVSVNNVTALITDVTVANGDMAGLDAVITLSVTGSILDLAGLSMINAVPTGTNDATFTIDNTAPAGHTFTIDQDPINSNNAGAVSVSFSGFEVGTSYSYSLSSRGGGTPITGSGTALISAGTLPPADVSALPDGMITASVTLTDAAGNAGPAATDRVLKDTVAPGVWSLDLRPDPITIANQSSVTLDVNVLETATTYTYTLSSSGGGTPITGTPATVSTNIFSVNLPTIVQLPDGVITASFVLTDPAGNSATAWTDTAIKDSTAPRIVSIVRQSSASPTNANSVTWRVTFDEPVSGVLESDFQVSGTTGSIAVNTVSSTVTDVTVSGGDLPNLNGSVGLAALTSGNIVDALGNAFSTAAPTGSSETFAIDNTPPSGYAVSIDQDPIGPSDDPITFTLTGLEIGASYTATLTSSGGGGTPFATRSATVASATETTVPIFLNGHLPDGTVTASLTLTDSVGNTGAAATDSVVKDATAPRIASFARQSSAALRTNADIVTWRITFNEAVSGVTAADFSVSGTTGTITVDNVSGTISDVSVSGGDMPALNGDVILRVLSGGIADLVGNALTNVSSLGTYESYYNLDNVGPEIRFISRQSPGSETTNADSVTWRLDGDALFNVTPDDFVLSGTTGSVSVAAVDIHNATWDVTASGGDMATLNGTVTLGFAPGQDITDDVGNPLASTTPVHGNTNTFLIDNAGPRVVSISRSSPATTPTNANRIIWEVVFDEPAVLSATDFMVSGTTAGIRVFTGDTPEAVVLWVDGGDMDALDGLVTLAFAAGQTITDNAGNALTNTTPTGGNENTWLIDNTAPDGYAIVIDQDPMNTINAAAVTLSYSGFEPGATYSYRVNDNSETVVIDGTGTVTQAAGTLQVGDLSAAPDSTIRATLSLTDTAGNVGTTVLDTVSKNTVAPRLTTILGGGAPTNADSLTFAFQFDKSVTNVDPSDFSVSGTTATVTSVSAFSPIYYQVTISGGDLADVANTTVTPSLAAGHDITDTNGNPLVNREPTGTSAEQIVNNSAPVGTFTSAAPGPVSGDFTVNLAFTPQAGPADGVQGFGQNDIVVGNGTIQSFGLVVTDGRTTGADFVIRPTADGPVTVDLPADRLEDMARNPNTAAIQFSIISDVTAPTVASILRDLDEAVTNRDTLAWTVRFSESVTDIGTGDFAVSGTTATVTSVSPLAIALPPSVAGDGVAAPFAVSSSGFTVTVSGGDLAGYNGPVALSFAAAQDISDAAGNALASTTPTGANETSYSLDNIAPTVTLSTTATAPVSGPFTITATFSEDVTGFDTSDLTVGNGTVSEFQVASASVYTATITPGTGSTITVDVAAAAANDPAGNPSVAATPFSMAHDQDRTLTLILPGVGAGTVTSAPAGVNCTSSCAADFTIASIITLTATPEPGSSFAGWRAGDCRSETATTCEVGLDRDTTVAARFTLDTPPAGRIVAATLPGARSGHVGGPAMSAFLSVVSRTTSPAQACRVTAPAGAPVTLAYRALDTNGVPTGEENPLFDIAAGGRLSLVIAMTPVSQTGTAGYSFLPVITCENASLDPIVGVNDVLLNIGAAPVPDILSIAATPSGDGVIRIPAPGRVQFMTVAAVNIGVGDGSGAAGDVTLTTTVDTGAAVLPLSLEVCQINAASVCITPRSPSVTSTMTGNDPLFFAVFVRDTSGGAGIAFNPASSRVFIRFADATGTIRSATSTAVLAPAAADAPITAGRPVGRWSVLMRQPDGIWPGLARTDIYVLENGRAVLDDGSSPRLASVTAGIAPGHFRMAGHDGDWTSDGSIRLGTAWSDLEGEFRGVRDSRSDSRVNFAALAGPYSPGDGSLGQSLVVAEDGSLSGMLAGCIALASPQVNVPPTGIVSWPITLMRCSIAGEYTAVLDVPANDNAEPALLVGNEVRGWRLER